MTYADSKVAEKAPAIRQVFVNYIYLQLLDFLTTIAFLANGVREANPFVHLMLTLFPNPMAGLLAVKLLALSLGVYCWRMRRERLLSYGNILFAALVAWNLIALILGSVAPRPE
jgi:Domain of unknown function (DUF5658)